ncbi:hypothetical protein F4778DRAFT_802075 [Xylariomycetidae sp. FL2044]|nr:hypothetical protein F4778DRAFT_802075 [Xylariomycetidae sp. FL2044]
MAVPINSIIHPQLFETERYEQAFYYEPEHTTGNADYHVTLPFKNGRREVSLTLRPIVRTVPVLYKTALVPLHRALFADAFRLMAVWDTELGGPCQSKDGPLIWDRQREGYAVIVRREDNDDLWQRSPERTAQGYEAWRSANYAIKSQDDAESYLLVVRARNPDRLPAADGGETLPKQLSTWTIPATPVSLDEHDLSMTHRIASNFLDDPKTVALIWNVDRREGHFVHVDVDGYEGYMRAYDPCMRWLWPETAPTHPDHEKWVRGCEDAYKRRRAIPHVSDLDAPVSLTGNAAA